MNIKNACLRGTAFLLLLIVICSMSASANETASSYVTSELINAYTCIHGCGPGEGDYCFELPVIVAVCEDDASFCELLQKDPPTKWDAWIDLSVKHLHSDPSLAHAGFAFAYARLFIQDDVTAWKDYSEYLAVLLSLDERYENLSLSGVSDLTNVSELPYFQDIIDNGGAKVPWALLLCAGPDIFAYITEDAISRGDRETLRNQAAYLEEEIHAWKVFKESPESTFDPKDIQALIEELEKELADLNTILAELKKEQGVMISDDPELRGAVLRGDVALLRQRVMELQEDLDALYAWIDQFPDSPSNDFDEIEELEGEIAYLNEMIAEVEKGGYDTSSTSE